MSLTTVDQDRHRQTFSPKSGSSSETPTTPTDLLLPQSNDTQEAQKDIRTYFLPATSKNVPREDIRIYFLPAESFKNNNQRGKSKPPVLKTNEKPNHVIEEITEPPPALFQEWKAPVYPPPHPISASKLPRTVAPKPKSPPLPPQKPQEIFQNRTTTLTDNKHHLIKFQHLEPILSPNPTNNNPDLPPTPTTPPSPQSPHHFDPTLIPPPLRPHPPSSSSSSPSSQKQQQQQQQSPLLPGHHHPPPLPLKHLDIITVGPTPTSVTPAAKARFEEWHRSQLARSNHFSLSLSPSNTVPLPRPVPPSDHPPPISTPDPILSRQHDDDHRFNRANNTTTSPRSHIPPVEPQPWTPQPTVAAVPSSSSSSCSSKNPHLDSARAPMSIPRKKVPLSHHHHHYHHLHQQQYQQYQHQHQQHRRNDTMPNARSPPPTLVAAGGESEPDGFSGAMWPEPARCRSLETFARWPYSPASPSAPHPPLPPPVPPRRDLPVLEMSRMRFEEGEDDGRGWEDWGSGSGGEGEWGESASESGGAFEGRRKDKGRGKEPKRTRIVRFLEGYSRNVEGLSMIQ